MTKFILDACCGNRMFWFIKNQPNTLYVDIRKEEKGLSELRPNFDVQPDEIMDFRALKLTSKTFKLVVFDPPHLFLSPTSEMRRKYGTLDKRSWKEDLTKGFNECWRVLEDYGILIFKWNESQIKIKEVLELFPIIPLFGHPSGSKSKTHWVCFMKFPETNELYPQNNTQDTLEPSKERYSSSYTSQEKA